LSIDAANPRHAERALADLRDGLSQWRLALALARLDLRNRYRGSVLGPLWMSLSTLIMLIGLGLLYGTLFKLELANYLPHLAVSLIIWQWMSTCITEACITLIGAEGVIRQMRLPYTLHALRIAFRNSLVAAHSLPIILLVFLVFGRVPGPEAFLAVGPVPREGDDQTFPGGFTIRAEKCPNRRGVEEVLAVYGAGGRSWTDLVAHVSAGSADAAWITAGYPGPWIDTAAADAFAGLGHLVVQDLFDSPLARLATWRLPAAGFAERAGTWVNVGHRAQCFEQAVRPPAGVWPEGRLSWNMLGRRGLYDPAAVRRQGPASAGDRQSCA
jgi:hypothetical protein